MKFVSLIDFEIVIGTEENGTNEKAPFGFSLHTYGGLQFTRRMTLSAGTGIIRSFNKQSWARTILHESIHPYLASYYAISRPGWIATYPEMVQDWGALQNWNDVHHEEIARSLVTMVAAALQDYGELMGYNLSTQFYEDMSWAGLQNTSTFNALSASEQKRILDVIAVELTGEDTDGNIKSQKGTDAGC